VVDTATAFQIPRAEKQKLKFHIELKSQRQLLIRWNYQHSLNLTTLEVAQPQALMSGQSEDSEITWIIWCGYA
jgi:hypothetical protein